jgi:hypothetical protein
MASAPPLAPIWLRREMTEVAAQDLVHQSPVAAVEVTHLQRASAERVAADLVQLRPACGVAADVMAHPGKAQRLHDLFFDVEMGRQVRAQGLQLEPGLGLLAGHESTVRGIEAGQQGGVRLVEDRQADMGRRRQAVGPGRLGFKPAGDHIRGHGCALHLLVGYGIQGKAGVAQRQFAAMV